MKALLLLLAFVPSIALADVLVVDPRNSYRRLDKPCTDPKVLPHIAEPARPSFRAGILKFEGKFYSSCWVEHQGMIFSVDEKGELLQPLPAEKFRDDTI